MAAWMKAAERSRKNGTIQARATDDPENPSRSIAALPPSPGERDRGRAA
jgi:hypothetical protein